MYRRRLDVFLEFEGDPEGSIATGSAWDPVALDEVVERLGDSGLVATVQGESIRDRAYSGAHDVVGTESIRCETPDAGDQNERPGACLVAIFRNFAVVQVDWPCRLSETECPREFHEAGVACIELLRGAARAPLVAGEPASGSDPAAWLDACAETCILYGWVNDASDRPMAVPIDLDPTGPYASQGAPSAGGANIWFRGVPFGGRRRLIGRDMPPAPADFMRAAAGIVDRTPELRVYSVHESGLRRASFTKPEGADLVIVDPRRPVSVSGATDDSTLVTFGARLRPDIALLGAWIPTMPPSDGQCRHIAEALAVLLDAGYSEIRDGGAPGAKPIRPNPATVRHAFNA